MTRPPSANRWVMMWLIQPRILRLDVEDRGLELDVVVEPHLRAPKARPLHLRVEFGELGGRITRHRVGECGVVAVHPFHALERQLRDAGSGVDAQRLSEQLLTLGIARAIGRPSAQQGHGLVRPLLLHQPGCYARCLRTQG